MTILNASLAASLLMSDRLAYSIERGEYVAALQAVTGGIMEAEMHQRWLRLLRHYTWSYYSFLAAAGIILIFISRQAASVLAFGVIVLIANSVLRYFVDRSQIAPLGATFDTRRHHEIAAVFGPERASQSGRGHEQSWDWTLLQRFHELPSVYVLEFAGFDMLVVPRRAFSSAAHAERWATDIRNRLPRNTASERMG